MPETSDFINGPVYKLWQIACCAADLQKLFMLRREWLMKRDSLVV